MIDALWQNILDPLTMVSFQKALLGGCLTAAACGAIGPFIVLRGMAFLGDALSHSMLAGVTVGYLLMQMAFGVEAHAGAMIVGALLAGLVTVVSVGAISRASRIKDDAAIGIMYTGIFAAGGLLTSYYSDRIHLHLYDYIMGIVLAVRDSQLWVMAVVAALVISLILLFFRQLQISTFDPVMAASIGVPVGLIHYMLTGCASLVVVSAVSVVGIILVVGLLITPAATAYLLCERLSRMVVLATTFGISSVILGLYMSDRVGRFAPGASIIVVATLQFLLVWLIAPRHGLIADWVRRRRIVPEKVLEDVLGCIRRNNQQPAPLSVIEHFVDEKPRLLRRAVRRLERRKWIERTSEGYLLTEMGGHEARRLLRAHRLWEAYLQQTGTPSAALHEQADRMEHVHDEAAVDYLDDQLGHPLIDPHGAEIPEDFVHLVPGSLVKASLLREGHRGTIESVGRLAKDLGLEKGAIVVAGPRRGEDRIWTLLLPDGQEVELDHSTADDVTVRFEPLDPS